LAPGRLVTDYSPVEFENEIGSMRPQFRRTRHSVANFVGGDRVAERCTFTPTGTVANRKSSTQQTLTELPCPRADASDISLPGGINRNAGVDKFVIPGTEFRGGRAALQRGIPLTEDAPVSPPGGQIVMFHVEHSPVEKATPFARAALHELMNAWI
jgi:hypothetical protein